MCPVFRVYGAAHDLTRAVVHGLDEVLAVESRYDADFSDPGAPGSGETVYKGHFQGRRSYRAVSQAWMRDYALPSGGGVQPGT